MGKQKREGWRTKCGQREGTEKIETGLEIGMQKDATGRKVLEHSGKEAGCGRGVMGREEGWRRLEGKPTKKRGRTENPMVLAHGPHNAPLLDVQG